VHGRLNPQKAVQILRDMKAQSQQPRDNENQEVK
jgi:hypothetical protein